MFMQDITRLSARPVPPALPGAATVTPRPQAPVAVTAAASGLVAGTRVETAQGWRPIESLRIGDRVHSLDGGLARIVALSRRHALPGEPVIRIAGGHFDACSDLMLMPGQELLLHTLGLYAAPYACLAARHLAACPGASRAIALRHAEIVTPIFAEEEVIWANSGLLLRCPGLSPVLPPAFPALCDADAAAFLAARIRRAA
jgi:hypothetical protein